MIGRGEDDSIGNALTGVMDGVRYRNVLLMRGCHALSMCLMSADRSQPLEREPMWDITMLPTIGHTTDGGPQTVHWRELSGENETISYHNNSALHEGMRSRNGVHCG
jgi:hypothetical protein